MVKLSKKIVSIITAAVVTSSIGFASLPAYEAKAVTSISVNESGSDSNNVLSALNSNQVQTYQATDYGLANKSKDGAILQAWCWSFNTIKANLKDIAEAGFTTVQTSPANNVCETSTTMKIMGNAGNGTDGAWWWQYQPTDWKIGNYQMGSEDDFKAMCAESDKYGVKIIVDVVPNHTTPNDSAVSQNLINAAGGWNKLYHSVKRCGNENWNCDGNRGNCVNTYGDLYDVCTENPAFQAYFLQYCNQLIADGCDGFRVDTTKHIGLPDDPVDGVTSSNGWKNNFWDVFTGRQSANGVSMAKINEIFYYGEVLGGTRADAYSRYLPITDSNYGANLRSAIWNKSFSASNLTNFQSGAGSNAITWVESHDTYCNGGESVKLTDWEIRMAWAVIAARKEGTPLFFSRPDGSNGWSNRWGNNVLGAKGNDQFKDSEVAAVNKFRNAMVGESENMRNINGSNQILSIERGSKGQVIINLGGDAQINSDTNLASGTYTDQVSGGTFTVSGGKISGSLKGGKVTVLYNAKVITTPSVSSSVASGNFDSNSLSVTLSAKNVTNAQYSIDGGTKTSYTDGTTVTLGANLANNSSTTLTLTGTGTDGTAVNQSYTYTKKTATYEAGYLYAKASGWGSAIYAYVYDESSGTAKTIAQWPGVKMTLDSDGRYSYKLPTEFQTANTKVIFTDGSNQYPASRQPGAAYVVGKALSFNGTSIDVKDPTQVVTPVVAGEISTDKVSPQNINTSINITTNAATGGTGKYTYQFDVNGTVIKSYSSGTTATWTPTAEGTYNISVTVKDSDGITATNSVTFVIKVDPVSDLKISSLTPSKASPQVVGTAIGLTAKTTGGVGTKKYSFVVKNSSKTTVYSKGYSTSAGTTWTPSTAGTYTITVYAKDNLKTVYKTISYTVKVTLAIKSLTTSVASPQNVGTAIKLTTSATGTGTIKYKFVAVKSGVIAYTRDYSTTNYTTWTPTADGTYTIYCYVKDSSTATPVSKTMTYTINKTKPVSISSVKTDVASPQKIGTGINISISATSSTSKTLSYKVSVYEPASGWKEIKAFSTASTTKWAPKSAGLCYIQAAVKDASGNSDTMLIPYQINS